MTQTNIRYLINLNHKTFKELYFPTINSRNSFLCNIYNKDTSFSHGFFIIKSKKI